MEKVKAGGKKITKNKKKSQIMELILKKLKQQ